MNQWKSLIFQIWPVRPITLDARDTALVGFVDKMSPLLVGVKLIEPTSKKRSCSSWPLSLVYGRGSHEVVQVVSIPCRRRSQFFKTRLYPKQRLREYNAPLPPFFETLFSIEQGRRNVRFRDLNLELNGDFLESLLDVRPGLKREERKKLKTGKQIRKKEKKTRETSRVIILDNRLSEKIIVLSSHSDYIPFLSIYSPRLHSYSFNLSSYYSAWITTIYRHHSLTHPLFSSSLVCGWHLLVLLRPRRQLRPSKK